jgi:hypothetical protein
MALYRYWLDGVHVESEFQLRSVPQADADNPPPCASPCLRLLLRPVDLAAIREWEELDTGISVGRAEAGYLLRCDDEFSCWVDRSGREIAFWIAPDIPHDSVEQTFLDQILPLILHLSGRYSFHASAVALGEAVVAFVGDTGRGKSTLASSLASNDGRIFCDDCLAVSLEEAQVRAYPSYPSTRLWPESANALFAHRGPLPCATPRTDKRRVALPWSAEPLPLRRIYLLELTEGPLAIARLGRVGAVGVLLRHLNRLDGRDKDRLVSELAFLEALVTAVPVARLSYRRDFAELAAVRAAILADVATISSPE